jgi:hypothetical protein
MGVEMEATLVLRQSKPRVRARGGDYTIYYAFGSYRKVGCTARLDLRLRELGIDEQHVRVLEAIPRSMGARHAAGRERYWTELLGTDPGTAYDEITRRRRKRQRR